MHDLLFRIIELAGPCHVTCATWSVSREAAELLALGMSDGRILSLACLFDWRVRVRCPEAMAVARMAGVDMRVCVCHAKVTLLQNAQHSITVVSSANMTNNPRIEAGVVFTDAASYAFHHEWISKEIANAKPFGVDLNRSGRPDSR